MGVDAVLYKYRAYNSKSLGILKSRELFFSSPAALNDPYDCQLNIRDAVEAALVQAKGRLTGKPVSRLEKLVSLPTHQKIQQHVAACGILSLSRCPGDTLLWTHYGDEHKGFCLGFRLSDTFRHYNKEHLIVGCDEVRYCVSNPFVDYFLEVANATEVPEWEAFWQTLFVIALTSKSEPWEYEQEVRVIRRDPGTVPFAASELSQVIFGVRMPRDQRETIREILSGGEWSHVRLFEVVRKHAGFELDIVEI